mgnify:CR=1 FL=1
MPNIQQQFFHIFLMKRRMVSHNLSHIRKLISIDSGSKEYCGIDHKSQRNYDKKAGIEVLDICYERVDNQ